MAQSHERRHSPNDHKRLNVRTSVASGANVLSSRFTKNAMPDGHLIVMVIESGDSALFIDACLSVGYGGGGSG